jgi:hypothetical protein
VPGCVEFGEAKEVKEVEEVKERKSGWCAEGQGGRKSWGMIARNVITVKVMVLNLYPSN